jgi:hypothetical protein
MALVFARRLALPMWTIAFLMLALTTPPPVALFLMPPTAPFVIAVAGIALVAFAMPCAMSWLRTSRSLVPVPPPRARVGGTP